MKWVLNLIIKFLQRVLSVDIIILKKDVDVEEAIKKIKDSPM